MTTVAAAAAAAGLAASVWLVIFQLLLAAGAPLGALAWGGESRGRLPLPKRVASLFAALLMAAFVGLFGQVLGLWAPLTGSPRWAFGAGVVIFTLSTFANLATKSRAERLLGAPIAFILAVSSAVLAFS